MSNLDTLSAACAVIIDAGNAAGFRHWATAWQVAAGEWLTVWPHEEPPAPQCEVLASHSGAVTTLSDWEQEGVMAGFRAELGAGLLSVAENDGQLHKRQTLSVVGYPSVIDHPSFSIHRGSLTAERYHPYLCPWQTRGHLALFTAEYGWLAGRSYHGMIGAPVLNQQGTVVGMVDEISTSDTHQPPLTRFRRIGS